jgi:hypothetical protein
MGKLRCREVKWAFQVPKASFKQLSYDPFVSKIESCWAEPVMTRTVVMFSNPLQHTHLFPLFAVKSCWKERKNIIVKVIYNGLRQCYVILCIETRHFITKTRWYLNHKRGKFPQTSPIKLCNVISDFWTFFFSAILASNFLFCHEEVKANVTSIFLNDLNEGRSPW